MANDGDRAGRSGRRPTQSEMRLWQTVMKDINKAAGELRETLTPRPLGPDQSGRRLKGHEAATHLPKSSGPKATPLGPQRKAEPTLVVQKKPPAFFGPKAGGLDRRTQTKLKRGKLEIEGRLDLHGMTQDQARAALNRFIPAMQRQNKRCVLVITGKGKGRDWRGDPLPVPDAPWEKKGKMRGPSRGRGFEMPTRSGILREQVPRWLREEPIGAMVVSVEQAQPRHGGTGALYVYLRRNR